MHQLRIKGKTGEASFYEELQHVFDHLPTNHIKIMLGEFNAILGREYLYKPTMTADM
jgi:predicted nucleotidyltransferase